MMRRPESMYSNSCFLAAVFLLLAGPLSACFAAPSAPIPPRDRRTIASGTAADVRKLFQRNPVYLPEPDGTTILMLAAESNPDPQVISIIIHGTANYIINNTDGKGRTALMRAAGFSSNPAVVDALLDEGADYSFADRDNRFVWDFMRENPAMRGSRALARLEKNAADNAFIRVCGNGDHGQVADALKRGANPNAETFSGWTALMYVCEMNRDPEIVKTLISAGADVRARSKRGDTALLWAAFNCDVSTVGLLLDAGADIEAMDDNGVFTVNPLMAAGWNRYHPDVFRFLLARGADPRAVTPDGTTVLMSVLGISNDKEPNLDLVKVLLDIGVDVRVENKRKTCALDVAAFKKDPRIAEAIVRKGAEINRRSRLGQTPLFTACSSGMTMTAKYLISAGADPTIPDEMGRMPADVSKTYPEIQALLKAGRGGSAGK